MNNMRFDNENSKCVSAERMTPEELCQLHLLTIVRRPVLAAGWNMIAPCMDVPSSAKHCGCWEVRRMPVFDSSCLY